MSEEKENINNSAQRKTAEATRKRQSKAKTELPKVLYYTLDGRAATVITGKDGFVFLAHLFDWR